MFLLLFTVYKLNFRKDVEIGWDPEEIGLVVSFK